MTDLSREWDDYTYVAVDVETTGAYPLGSEVCEVAAVKWHKGQVIDEYQSLIRPTQIMSDFIIGIHGITNEMVAGARPIEPVIKELHQFIGDAIAVAHHAPFDMGFLTAAFEDAQIQLPMAPALCTSLLSRSLFPEMPNHKLQTLVKELSLPGGAAHRALDDSKNCLQLFLKCAERAKQYFPNGPLTLQNFAGKQGKPFEWTRFSISEFTKEPSGRAIVEAIQTNKNLEIVYMSGSHKGKPREVKPVGIVRNPDGDFIAALDVIEPANSAKRFYMNKMKSANILIG